MIFRSSLTSFHASLFLGVLAACGGGGVSNGTPRIGVIPPRIQPGSAVLSFDVGVYVVDREGDAMTFSVVSGGGSFAGSVYSNTFTTMGRYTVVFEVRDALGNAATGQFEAVITSANLAAVQQGTTGLLLLDTFSNEMVQVAAGSAQPTFKAGLADGRMVFERGSGASRDVVVFDTYTRSSVPCAEPTATEVTFCCTTDDGRIVLTTGAAPDTDLFAYNPLTSQLTEVSAVVGEADGNPIANQANLVFYERGQGGQRDIYCFDSATDTSAAVSTDANDEQLLAVLANGAAVFGRVGPGGETDLHYYEQGTGLVEVGLDMPVLGPRNKTYAGGGSGGQVVFTAQNGADVDLFAWDPAGGVTTTLASVGVYGFEAIGAGNEVVYRHEVSAGDHDLHFRDLDDGTTGVVRNAADIGSALAVTSDGAVQWAVVQGSGAVGSISVVRLTGAPLTSTWGPGGTVALAGVLANGDVVAQRTDGTALALFDVAAGGWSMVLGGVGLAFAGDGLEPGDFVYAVEVAGQTDLSMWDESATASVVVSAAVDDDAFAAATGDGTLLFARTPTGGANADLFAWHPTNGELQLTTSTGTTTVYSVSGTFSGVR